MLYPIALIAGGFWLVYRNTPSIKDKLLEKKQVTYQKLIALETLKTAIKCRVNELFDNPRQKVGPTLFNDLYITKLESDYLYLTEKRPERNLYVEMQTRISWWMFRFGNKEKIHLLNNYGDLV